MEELPVRVAEPLRSPRALPFGELAKGRQADEVRGHRPGGGDPPPLDGFEEPAEHVADPGGAARTGDGEESLGESPSLGAAEPALGSQGIHLVRESLEMRVEHLRGSVITRGRGKGQRLRDDGTVRSGPVGSGRAG